MDFECSECAVTATANEFMNAKAGRVECPLCGNRIIYLAGQAPKGFSRNLVEQTCDEISGRDHVMNATSYHPPAEYINLADWIKGEHGLDVALEFLFTRAERKYAADMIPQVRGVSDEEILENWLNTNGITIEEKIEELSKDV